MTETALSGGDLNVVVRVGETVRRPVGHWTPAVHALLRHFERVGFDGAPRALGIDEQGREILTYVEGEPALAPAPAGDDALGELGRLLRRMHDAQAGFEAPPDARWQVGPAGPPAGDVICHADLFPPNVVFRDGLPVALIDWDLARPAPRLHDLRSAASFWAPLRPDEHCVRWGFAPPRRGERLRLLCDAYELEPGDRRALVPYLLDRRLDGYELHRVWGGVERRPGWRELWDAGSGAETLGNARWLEEHAGELAAALR